MSHILNAIKSFIYSLLFIVILLASFVFFLVATKPGLYLSIQLAKIALPGKLHIENMEGRLIDHFSIKVLNYHDEEINLDLKNFSGKWLWKSLFNHQLIVENLQADRLNLSLLKVRPNFQLPKLPFDLILNKVSINQIGITKDASTYEFNTLDLQAKLTNQLWQIDRLNFNFAHINFTAEVKIQPVLPFAISAKLGFKPFTSLNPFFNGQLTFGGDLSLYHWHGEINNPTTFVINGTLKNGQELHMNSNWRQFSWPLFQQMNLESPEGSFKIDGKLPELTSRLESTLTSPFPAKLQLNTQVTLQNFNTTGQIKVPQGAINLNLQYEKNRFNGQIGLGKNQLQIKGSSVSQWELKAELPEAKLFHPSLANLQTLITAKASLNKPTEGQLTLTIHPGSYQLAEGASLQFVGGEIKAQLTRTNLNLKGKLTLDQYKSLMLSLDLPQFQLDKGWSKTQDIKGSLSLNVNSFAFLENLNAGISKAQGQLQAILKASGTLSKPIVEGTISLDKAGFLIPQLGLNLNPIQINIKSHEKHWDAVGSLNAEGKSLTLKGQGEFIPKLTGSINIEGEHFPLAKTNDYFINVSPQLVLNLSPKSIDLTGTVLIPSAEIKQPSFSKSVSLSEDVVFAGAEAPAPTNPLHINTDIQLKMGDQVALDVKGLKGFLDGVIHLRQLPQGPLKANGELDVREGQYKAYGQDLAIEEGQLIFTGGLINNPGIHVRAIRRFNNTAASLSGSNELLDFNVTNSQALDVGNSTTVGIEVSGRIKSPKIDLFSVPPTLSQADILSMLLLGKPIKYADKAGGQLLLSAVSSLNLGSGTNGAQLLDQLKQTLGVDVNIQSTTKINQQTHQISESSSVVVGKSVSKRLYVSYNFGLAQADVNVLTITYLLNKFLSIQVNASTTASGIDLLYTHRKENK